MHDRRIRGRERALRMTVHGAVRSKQRVIPPAVVEALLDFGEDQRAPGGVFYYRFGKRGWRAFQAYLGPAAKHLDRYRSAYAVVADDGSVITVGWEH